MPMLLSWISQWLKIVSWSNALPFELSFVGRPPRPSQLCWQISGLPAGRRLLATMIAGQAREWYLQPKHEHFHQCQCHLQSQLIMLTSGYCTSFSVGLRSPVRPDINALDIMDSQIQRGSEWSSLETAVSKVGWQVEVGLPGITSSKWF